MLKKLEHNVDLAIEIAADRLAGHILHHKNDAKLGELCASALAALIQSAAVYGSILVLAAAFRMFWDSILWTVFFFAARCWTAGAHAASRLACYLLSLSVSLGCLFAARLLPASLWLTACINAANVIIVFVTAPADSDIGSAERRRMRIYARLEVVAAVASAVLLAEFTRASFAYAASLGTLSAAISSLIKWKEVHNRCRLV